MSRPLIPKVVISEPSTAHPLIRIAVSSESIQSPIVRTTWPTIEQPHSFSKWVRDRGFANTLETCVRRTSSNKKRSESWAHFVLEVQKVMHEKGVIPFRDHPTESGISTCNNDEEFDQIISSQESAIERFREVNNPMCLADQMVEEVSNLWKQGDTSEVS